MSALILSPYSISVQKPGNHAFPVTITTCQHTLRADNLESKHEADRSDGIFHLLTASSHESNSSFPHFHHSFLRICACKHCVGASEYPSTTS